MPPRRDILDRAPNIDANKRSDHQRLPLDKTTDRKQNNAALEMAAL